MINLDRCFILGGGYSLKEGIDKGLFDKLTTEVTFSLNENIRFFNPTVALFGDYYCYHSRYEWFKLHPLTIMVDKPANPVKHPEFPYELQDDLILLKSSLVPNPTNGLEKGLYSPVLTGIFTISLAKELGFKQIFLLGFDNCAINGKTHWYEGLTPDAGIFKDINEIERSGVGFRHDGKYKTSVYDNRDESINELWKPVSSGVMDTSVINVSIQSRINVFPKLAYTDLFQMLNDCPAEVDNNEMRSYLRKILNPYNLLKK